MPNNMLIILEQEKNELLKKLSLINQVINAYRLDKKSDDSKGNIVKLLGIYEEVNSNIISIDKYYSYNIDYPIRKKIVTIIQNENRFLHVREIAAIANQLEPEISTHLFIKKISPALSVLKSIPQSGLVSIVVENSHFNTFWGNKNWLDNEGNIVAPFTYNVNQLNSFNKQPICF